MLKYHVWTVGCQMNKADSEQLATRLEGLGYLPVADPGQADVVVVNSCSVRASAEQRVQGKLGMLKSVKRRRPEMLVALVGCMVGPYSGDLAGRFPHVDVFCRPQQFDPLVDRARSLAAAVEAADPEGIDALRDAPVRPGAVTAYVPIIHGCDKFCTYCIVPYRRGREKSRPISEIVAEVEDLVARGVREVTLLGQTVDSYGNDWKDQQGDLADLLEALDPIPGLERIRFLTSYPPDMTDRIIDAVARLPKVCEHFNIPVQAGHDAVLESMRRGYTVAEYVDLVGRIRARIPAVTIATDVIVGYPGETDAQFEATRALLEDLRFDTVHVAAYSPRPGTIAIRTMTDDVTPEVKKERLHVVERLQEMVAGEITARLLDSVQEVLVEGQKDGRWMGRTRGNKLVFFEADGVEPGMTIAVRITRTSPWSLGGTVEQPAVACTGS